MPGHFAARSRSRRLTALIAAGAMVLQALVLGTATAHAFAAPDAALGVVCHGAPSSASDQAPAPAGAPDADKAGQVCCLLCAAAASVDAKAPAIFASIPFGPAAASPISADHIVIARAVVRAGRSQAPPDRA
jgi:hypothetical protein